jgi:hypothetical protein
MQTANTPELPRKLSLIFNACFNPFPPLFPPWEKFVAAGADVQQQFAAQLRANEYSYGDVGRGVCGISI